MVQLGVLINWLNSRSLIEVGGCAPGPLNTDGVRRRVPARCDSPAALTSADDVSTFSLQHWPVEAMAILTKK